jgi:hypothetical protein
MTSLKLNKTSMMKPWITSHRTAHTRQQKSHLEHHYSNNMAAFQLTVTGVRNAIIEDIPSDTMKREK